MYCPTCGLNHTETRRFCNRCGTNLELVTRTLSGDILSPVAAEKLEKRQKAMSRAFWVFCSGPIFGFSLLILSELVAKLPYISSRSPFGYIPPPLVPLIENLAIFGLIFSLVGAMMMIHTYLIYGRKKSITDQFPASLHVSQEPQTRTVVPPDADSRRSPVHVTSVTESTTYPLGGKEASGLELDSSQTEWNQPGRGPKHLDERGQ